MALQVAKSIKIVMSSRLASIVVSLDLDRIEESQLQIDANTVRESILQTPKIKPKNQVKKFSSCMRLARCPSNYFYNLPYVLGSSKLRFWILESWK